MVYATSWAAPADVPALPVYHRLDDPQGVAHALHGTVNEREVIFAFAKPATSVILQIESASAAGGTWTALLSGQRVRLEDEGGGGGRLKATTGPDGVCVLVGPERQGMSIAVVAMTGPHSRKHFLSSQSPAPGSGNAASGRTWWNAA